MHPILFQFPASIPLIGGLSLYTYGVLVATAFLLGMLWTLREARLAGVDRNQVSDLTFYVILAAIIGSRLFYVIVEHERFVREPLAVFRIWEGGLVFYGGLLGCIAVSWWYTHRHGWSLARTADLFMPGVALGHAMGRLGCLMAGCCYGRPVSGDPWWALTFPANEHGLAPVGIPLYPTQLLESLAELFIFGLLIWRRRHQRFAGQVFLLYLISYAILRSLLEILRGDQVRGFVVPGILSVAQMMSLVVILACLVAYHRLRNRTSL